MRLRHLSARCRRLEAVFGRHRADTAKVSGVSPAAYDSAEALGPAAGRDPRVRRLRPTAAAPRDRQGWARTADRGAKVVATQRTADLGFDVDVAPLPDPEAARPAVENGDPRGRHLHLAPPATRPWCRPSIRALRSARAPPTSSFFVRWRPSRNGLRLPPTPPASGRL